jgi:tetraacyldisaccharide 4'-kinase
MPALPLPPKIKPSNVHWLQNYWFRITWLHLILFPVSLLFFILVLWRRLLYRNRILPSHKLPVPVIVVGNISVGGTGKTPLTLAVAGKLVDRGWHPLIVSRGYGGLSQMPQQVRANGDARQTGDEPLLMARRNLCPVWIGKDRVAAAQSALQANPQCDVVLCDDGLQHYRLERDVEIAVVDGARGFGNGLMLPAGPLREPLSRLNTVDAVVVNSGEASTGRYAMRLSGAFFHNLLEPGRTVAASHFYALKNHAVAGIGYPERYFQHLRALGIPFTRHVFPDHHFYIERDLIFQDCEAILLTEKDAVKCAEFADSRYWVLRVEAEIDPTLIDNILRKIASYGRKIA